MFLYFLVHHSAKFLSYISLANISLNLKVAHILFDAFVLKAVLLYTYICPLSTQNRCLSATFVFGTFCLRLRLLVSRCHHKILYLNCSAETLMACVILLVETVAEL